MDAACARRSWDRPPTSVRVWMGPSWQRSWARRVHPEVRKGTGGCWVALPFPVAMGVSGHAHRKWLTPRKCVPGSSTSSQCLGRALALTFWPEQSWRSPAALGGLSAQLADAQPAAFSAFIGSEGMGLARCCGLCVGSGSCPAPVGCCHLVLPLTYVPGTYTPVLWPGSLSCICGAVHHDVGRGLGGRLPCPTCV